MKGETMMTKEERSTYWQNLVSKQIDSGLTGAAFCREHQINPGRFYHWRRLYQNEEPRDRHLGAFLELVPYEKKSSAGIHIRLGNGLSIEVERDFDPATLRATIQTICHGEPMPCLP
jgi:hypothetical protein